MKEKARQLLADAQAVSSKAQAAGRPLTDGEKAQVTAALDQIEALEDSLTLTKQIDSLTAGMTKGGSWTLPGAGGGSSIGATIAALPGLVERKSLGGDGLWTTGVIPVDGVDMLSFGAKATVTETASPVVTPDYQAGVVPTLFRRLTVQDLIAGGGTDSNQVTYAAETTATNAAAAVAEEAAKPESTIIMALTNEPVRKVATWIPVSEEMLDDAPAMRAYLDSRLRIFVQQALEAQLLNGNGTAPNLRGLLNRTGVQTLATVTPLTGVKTIEGIFDSAALVSSNAFLDPDAFVIHPTDWARIRKQREDTGGAGTGGYLAGSPFSAGAGIGGVGLWGLRAVVTPAIAAGTVLVGAFRDSAQFFARGPLTVEATNAHSDFFTKDLVALRCEQRGALAVYRAPGFTKLTLTP
jgi:HK97 family phage major capsid protein